MRLILGSNSPRRKEILSYFKIPFEQRSPDFDEESVPFEGDARKYAQTLSRSKAESFKISETILTADTVVFKEGKIFNKPTNEEESLSMLSELNGKWHSVFTALTMIHEGKEITECEETKVLFHHFSKEELQLYIKKIHTFDKAGGYAIQGNGSVIVKRIDGCYYNVMGLPINALRKLFSDFGLNLLNFL